VPEATNKVGYHTFSAQKLVAASILFFVAILQIELAYADALNTLSDTQTSVKANTLSDHTIQFITPTGVTTGQSISVTFPAGYVMGTSTLLNVDLATSTSGICSGFNQETLALSPSNGTWGYSTSSQTITFTSGTGVIAPNRCIQIKVGSNATFGGTGVTQITNPGIGQYTLSIGGTMADNGIISTNIITDDTVVLFAAVQQALSFSISTTTIYFGTLTSGAAKYASSTNPAGDTTENVAHQLLVATNAPSGFAVTVHGQTLTSQQNLSNTIDAIGPTVASSTPGSEQFGFRATQSGGIGVAIAPTFAAPTSYGYDGTATTSTILATGSGSTPVSTISLRYLANINPITEAGSYVANLVYVATANF
jgi:hypothetical protein